MENNRRLVSSYKSNENAKRSICLKITAPFNNFKHRISGVFQFSSTQGGIYYD